jgi:hypothetical protein
LMQQYKLCMLRASTLASDPPSTAVGIDVDLTVPNVSVYELLVHRMPHIPAVLLTVVLPLVAMAWIGVLLVAASQVVWLTVTLTALACVGITMLPVFTLFPVFTLWFTLWHGYARIAVLVILSIVIIVVFARYIRNVRSNIAKAGSHVVVATHALTTACNRHIFAAALCCHVGVLLVVFTAAWSSGSGYYVMRIVPGSCSMLTSPWGSYVNGAVSVNAIWLVSFLRSAQLQATAMATSAWFFEQPTKYAAFKGLQHACTTSRGTLTIVSIAGTPPDDLPPWRAQLWSTFESLWYHLFGGVLTNMARVSVIVHGLTGESLATSRKKAAFVLQRDGMAGNTTAQMAAGEDCLIIMQSLVACLLVLIGVCVYVCMYVYLCDTLGSMSSQQLNSTYTCTTCIFAACRETPQYPSSL